MASLDSLVVGEFQLISSTAAAKVITSIPLIGWREASVSPAGSHASVASMDCSLSPLSGLQTWSENRTSLSAGSTVSTVSEPQQGRGHGHCQGRGRVSKSASVEGPPLAIDQLLTPPSLVIDECSSESGGYDSKLQLR